MSWERVTFRRERLGTLADKSYVVVDLEIRRRPGTATTVDHVDIVDPLEVSLTGTVHEYRHREPYGAGQIVDTLADIVTPAPGWTLEEIRELATLWDRWHLNTMRAACAHMVPGDLVREDNGYGGTRISTSDPRNVCPDTGYRYGHAWLVEPVPADVVARLEELMRSRSQDLYRARGYDASGRPVDKDPS